MCCGRVAAMFPCLFRKGMKDNLIICIILLVLLASAFFAGRLTKHVEPQEIEVVKTDTLTVHDTTFIDRPVPVREKLVEKIYVPVTDTLHLHDTTFIVLPRTQKEYTDSLYHAYVSGFQPQLDSIQIFQKTKYITTTIREPAKKWHVGVMAGYGVTLNNKQVVLSPYLGVGVTYSILSF